MWPIGAVLGSLSCRMDNVFGMMIMVSIESMVVEMVMVGIGCGLVSSPSSSSSI